MEPLRFPPKGCRQAVLGGTGRVPKLGGVAPPLYLKQHLSIQYYLRVETPTGVVTGRQETEHKSQTGSRAVVATVLD